MSSYKVINFHKQEFLDHVYTHDCRDCSRKRDRGFAPFIADIVENCVNNDMTYQELLPSLIELGIGGGGSHYMWDCHFRGRIYGVELYSPDESYEYTNEYSFYEEEANQKRNSANYNHSQHMLKNLSQVKFYYGMDAYAKTTAEHIYNVNNGPIDIVIDDADPSGHGLRTLLPAWRSSISPTGCMISETIYGNGSAALSKKSPEERLDLLKVAHDQGFMCYDLSKYAYSRPETEYVIHHLVFWSPAINLYKDVLDKYEDCRVTF